MREIKFRAWDKSNERIMYRGVFNRNWYTGPKAGRCIKGMRPDDAYKVELMQYTGLKDKNGTEIYEGDIVTIQTNQTKTVFREVYFSNGAYRLSDSRIILTELEVSDFNLTVVGNIYENPELLKGDVTARIAASINARVNQGREANERW